MATTAATTGSGPAARWVVRGAGLVLTAVAVAVHVRFWVEAGGLWRDEVNSVVLANGPSVRQLWQTLPYDSFPVLWHAVVRAWSALAGTGDPAARGLGLAVGLSVLAILWWNGRRFGAPAPVVGLVLFGFTSPVLLYGDSVRGYGLGIATALLALGTVWDLSRGVTRWRVVAAGAACLAAVHVLFYNAALVPAFCCGGAAAALTRGGRPGRAAAVAALAVGGVAGASLAVYLPVLRRASGVTRLARGPWSWAQTGGDLLAALRFDQPAGRAASAWPGVWAAAIAVGLTAGGVTLWRSRRATDPAAAGRRAAIVFALVSLGVGVAADTAFLRVLQYQLRPWYFLAGLTVVAGTMDPLYAAGLSVRRQAAVAVLWPSPPPPWPCRPCGPTPTSAGRTSTGPRPS